MHSAFQTGLKENLERATVFTALTGARGHPGAGHFQIKQGRLKDRHVVVECDS